ncbi:MAG TPA: NAD(P)-binding protein [Pirellulaceae bacterium]|nr:NAD(P)-binding protein [Pirellulaceae bacterium]
MPLRLTNLELPVEQPETALADLLAQRLGVPVSELGSWRILRKSLDARSRQRLKYVYSAVVSAPQLEAKLPAKAIPGLDAYDSPLFDEPSFGTAPMADRPVVIGSGPAGLLAGYYLAARGYRPIILERGAPVKERVSAIREFDGGGAFDRENNYLFGEGGAGAFSDGKLTCRMTGADVDYVLARFVDCGGRSSITYEHRPHLGSNRLPMICRNFRRATEALGGEYRFGCCVESLDIDAGQLRGLGTSNGYLKTNAAILAIGHSARDTYSMLHQVGVPMQAKAFQLGLRIEQPQSVVNEHKYAHERYLDLLGAADYTLVAHGQRDLFTFCMCAGGWIIPSVSEPEMFCTNGMSNSRHDTPFANSGLVVTLEPHEFGSDHPLAGVEVQRKYEALAFQLAGRNYHSPIQRAHDFVAGRTPAASERIESSYQRGATPLNLLQLLPPAIAQAVQAGLPIMDRKWRGDFLRDAILVGPEMRGSSPVRIVRDVATFESPTVAGLYPVGEGAGFAGGIISAAVDGLRAAKKVVGRFAPV